MTGRRIPVALTIVLFGCRPAAITMPDAFPATVGAWHRVSLRDWTASDLVAAAQVPDPVPPASIERLRAASYEGPGKVEARVYQLTNAAVALDVAQRWAHAPDTVVFESDRFFVVVRWSAAERKSLQEFVRELEKKFPGKQPQAP
jgi:hypothetical protein